MSGRDRVCSTLGKTATVVFVFSYFLAKEPFLRSLVSDLFVLFLMKIIENNQKMWFSLICLPPGRRFLLTPGMGMGGGDHLGSFGTIWVSLWYQQMVPL